MKTILVTGASSGIGQAIYQYYKDQSPENIVIGASRRGPDVSLDFEEALKTSKGFKDLFRNAYDIVVLAAGIMPLIERGLEQKILDINYYANAQILDELFTYNYIKPGGCVIGISSNCVTFPDAHQPFYAQSKKAFEDLLKMYARKYASVYRVNWTRLGFFKTNLVPGVLPIELLKTIPIGYEADPAQILPVIRCLEEATYMTGSCITIDGGASL